MARYSMMGVLYFEARYLRLVFCRCSGPLVRYGFLFRYWNAGGFRFSKVVWPAIFYGLRRFHGALVFHGFLRWHGSLLDNGSLSFCGALSVFGFLRCDGALIISGLLRGDGSLV